MPIENPGRVFSTGKILDLLKAVNHEIERAVAAHGSMTNRHEAYAIIAEELDEFWDEVKKNPRKMRIAEELAWQENMRKELIQVAAMAIRAIYDLNIGEV